MGVWYGGNARYSETAEQRDPMRTCKHCGLTMPLSQFPMHPKPSGGWSYSQACGACEQAAREAAERREELRRLNREKKGAVLVYCSHCKQVRPIRYFEKKSGGSFKTCEVCRAKARAKARQRLYEKGVENER